MATLPLDEFRQVADHVTGDVVAGAGHWVPEQRPLELAARIEAFLGACCP